MEIAFTIPTWVLWLVGIPVGIIIVALAVIGLMFIWAFRGGYR